MVEQSSIMDNDSLQIGWLVLSLWGPVMGTWCHATARMACQHRDLEVPLTVALFSAHVGAKSLCKWRCLVVSMTWYQP